MPWERHAEPDPPGQREPSHRSPIARRRYALLALVLGIAAGISWWVAIGNQPGSVPIAPHDEGTQAHDRQTRPQVTQTAEARDLVESLHPPAEQPPQPNEFTYDLAGTVTPPPGGPCTIEFVFPDDTNDASSHPVSPTGQFSASLPEARIPPGSTVFARVRSGPKVIFAGPVPAVPGLRLQAVSPVRVRGVVRVRFPKLRDGEAKTLSTEDVRIGIQGWLSDSFVTVQPDDAGRFEAEVLAPPSGALPIVVYLEPGMHTLYRAEFSTIELAGGVDIVVRAGVLRIDVSDHRGDPVPGTRITAGWNAAESRRDQEERFFPVELHGSPSGAPWFLVAPGTIAGTVTAPNLSPVAFRREVSAGEDATHTVTMVPSETEQLRVRLVDETGKPTQGWVFAQASEDTARPGAYAASELTSGDECIAVLEVPSNQPVDLYCGDGRRPEIGTEVRHASPGSDLTVEIPSGARVEIRPMYLSTNSVIRGRHSTWTAIPRQGGQLETGIASQAVVPIDLSVGIYDIVVVNTDAQCAGVLTTSVQHDEDTTPLDVPMMPLQGVQVALREAAKARRAFVRFEDFDHPAFEQWFETEFEGSQGVDLMVPDFAGLEVCVEWLDGSTSGQAWNGSPTLIFEQSD